MSTSGHPTYAEYLRARTDDELIALLYARPDLASPLPGDFSALAQRAQSPASVARAIDMLNMGEYEILNALRGFPQHRISSEELTALITPYGTEANAALQKLEKLGLVWHTPQTFRVIGTVDEVCGPPFDPIRSEDQKPLGDLHLQPPTVVRQQITASTIDTAGAAAVTELIRYADQLLQECGQEPAIQLRTGGLGIKEFRRLTAAMGLGAHQAVTIIEACAAAGLLVFEHDVWLPSKAFDVWRQEEPQVRWATLASKWLTLPRLPQLALGIDQRGKRIAPLSVEMNRTGAHRLRTLLINVLAELPTDTGLRFPDALSILKWKHPRSVAVLGKELFSTIWTEAELFGIFARGALTTFGASLRQDPTEPEQISKAATALADVLPKPIDYVLVQPDLTVIAPGPLESMLATYLAAVAETESTGPATVYRVTPASVRRALSMGYSKTDLHELFTKHSRTPIPQALTYLIDDMARRYDTLRIGSVGGYLRSEDESTLVSLLADRRLNALQLRRIAPTVVVSPLSAHLLTELLAEAGYQAAAEDAAGVVAVADTTSHRARKSHSSPVPLKVPIPSMNEKSLRNSLEILRRSDSAVREARKVTTTTAETTSSPGQDLEEILDTIREAITDKAQILLNYVDSRGGVKIRLVNPISIKHGYVRAEDPRSESTLTVAINHIESVYRDKS